MKKIGCYNCKYANQKYSICMLYGSILFLEEETAPTFKCDSWEINARIKDKK